MIPVNKITQWHKCYDDGWKGLIVPEAFSHPAKMAYGLLKRILDHAKGWLKEGDVIIDPFGGIGSTGILGAYEGYQVVCCELEAKFVNLAEQNFELHKDAWVEFGNPFPAILQGDSRRLCEVVATVKDSLIVQADCIVSSPPYYEQQTGGGIQKSVSGKSDYPVVGGLARSKKAGRSAIGFGYGNQGQTPGQLGAMKPGKVEKVVKKDLTNSTQETIINNKKETVYEKEVEMGKKESRNRMALRDDGVESNSDRPVLQGEPKVHIENNEEIQNTQKAKRPSDERQESSKLQGRQKQPIVPNSDRKGQVPPVQHNGKSGDSPQKRQSLRPSAGKSGNSMQSLPHEHNQKEVVGSKESGATDTEKQCPDRLGQVSLICSSPPYAESLIQRTKRPNTKNTVRMNEMKGNMEYGQTKGNLGNLKSGDVDCVISSPPWENSQEGASVAGPSSGMFRGHKKEWYKSSQDKYGQTDGNIGNDKGDTFWQVAKEIVEQCYQILKPRGHAIWVVKSFVRKGKIVDFPGDWQRLCESVGFKTVCIHQAMLVKETKHQTLFGDTEVKRKERKSFFRRLAESKGSPRIDYEVVLCMGKSP